MNKDLQDIRDEFNQNQKKWFIRVINYSGSTKSYFIGLQKYKEIGFGKRIHIWVGVYEFITNPKYGLARTFKIPHGSLISNKILYELLPEKEIIKKVKEQLNETI